MKCNICMLISCPYRIVTLTYSYVCIID